MKVFVIGSINMDVVAVSERHPQPGETVMGSQLHLMPGGKGANQAVAARLAGAETAIFGRVGGDPFADDLLAFLDDRLVDVSHVERIPGEPSGTALIVVADGENTITVVPGANHSLGPEHVGELSPAAGDVLVAQLEVPQPAIFAAFEIARERGATTVLNAAPAIPCDPALLAATDVLVVNETELSRMLGGPTVATASPDQAIADASRLRRGDQTVVVTLGAQGVVAVGPASALRVEGHAVEVVDTTGAGDCFVGNLAAQLAAGAELKSALQIANLAASICVQRMGAAASMPARDDLPDRQLQRFAA